MFDMFDQEEYWNRRNHTVEFGKGKGKIVLRKPLRGQGDEFNPAGGRVDKIGGKPVSKKAIRKLAKRARKAGYEKDPETQKVSRPRLP